jgi:ABC-2 type transport system ATP-binding protein
LRKSYGDVHAVRDFTLTVRAGEMWGLVGPNGCGKTTSIEAAIGLRSRDGGSVDCMGVDPSRSPRQLVGKVAVQLQGAAIHPSIKVREHLEYVAASFGQFDRITDAVSVFRLEEYENVQFGRLSGGSQRRVLVAAAYLTEPRLLILDEPTSGVDPEARIALWMSLTRASRLDELAVLVTTHDLAEAERYLSLFAVMRDGVVVAAGTLDEIRNSLRTNVVAVAMLDDDSDSASGGSHNGGAAVSRTLADRLLVGAADERELAWVADRYPETDVRTATLEDVYLLHTGGRSGA